MSDQRSIELRLRANFSDFNSNIDAAAQKANKFGQELEQSSKKVEQARSRQRDAAQQVETAEKRLAAAVHDSKATASQLARAQKEVERAKSANKAATDALTTAEKQHAQVSARAATAGGRLAQSAEQNSQAWQTAGGILVAAGGAITALGAAALRTGIDYNTLQQSSRAALRTLLGGAEAANAQMDRLDAFAKTSPFAKQVFITAQQQMIAFGISTQKVIPYLDALNDATAAAGGSGQTLSELAFIMAQISAAGKISAQDLMQFGQRGIDAAGLIGSAMGKTGAEIRAAITSGALDANTALDALADGMKAKYGGAAANVKQTWVGATDRIRSAWRDLSSDLAEPLVGKNGGGALVGLANQGADLMRTFQKLPGPVKVTAAAVAGLAGASALAAGGIMLLTPRLVQTKKDLAVLGDHFPKLSKSMGVAGVVAKGLGAALAVGTAALAIWAAVSADAEARTAGFASTLEVVDGRVRTTDGTLRELNRQIVEQKTGWMSFMGVGTTVADMLDRYGINSKTASDYIVGAAGAQDQLNAAMDSYIARMKGEGKEVLAGDQMKRFRQELDYLAGNLSEAEKRALQTAAANKEAGVSADDAADGTDKYAGALDKQGSAATKAADQLKKLLNAIWAASDATRAKNDVDMNWYETLDATAKTLKDNSAAIKKHGGALSIATEKGRENARALDSLREAAKNRINQMIEEGQSADRVAAVTQKMRDKYVDAAEKAGYFGKKAQEAADKAGLIPKQVKMEMVVSASTANAEKSLEAVKASVEGLPENVQTEVLSKFHDDGIEAAYSALAKVDKARAKALILSILDRNGIASWEKYRPPSKTAAIYTKVYGAKGGPQFTAATGGPVFGEGTETSDSIHALLSHNEHVWSAREVRGAGGHSNMERLRAMARSGRMPAFRDGGRVISALSDWDSDDVQRFASGGAAKKKADAAKKKALKAAKARAEARKASAEARAELLRDLKVDVRRDNIREDTVDGQGMSWVDQMITWSRDSNLSKGARDRLGKKALEFEKQLGALGKKLTDSEKLADQLAQKYDQVKSALTSEFSIKSALEEGRTQRFDAKTGRATWSDTTAKSITQQAQQRAAKIKAFAGKLDALRKAGASPAVIEEIAALGSDEGSRTADLFLNDNKALKDLNKAYADIDTWAGKAGQYVTEASYKGGLAAAEAMVKTLQSQLGKLGSDMAKEFAKALGMNITGDRVTKPKPKPKPKKKRAAGGPVSAGELYEVNELGFEAFRPAVNGYILNAQQTARSGSSVTNQYFIDGRQIGLNPRLQAALNVVADVLEEGPMLARAGG